MPLDKGGPPKPPSVRACVHIRVCDTQTLLRAHESSPYPQALGGGGGWWWWWLVVLVVVVGYMRWWWWWLVVVVGGGGGGQ